MLSKLAADIRFMQFYAHNAHNLIKGSTFFQDHGFLGELYPKYEEIYDSLVERIIGADENIDLIKINQIAFDTMKEAGISDDPKKIFTNLVNFEDYICIQIEELVAGYSEGTRQMLGTIADESEVRQYKMKQRLK